MNSVRILSFAIALFGGFLNVGAQEKPGDLQAKVNEAVKVYKAGDTKGSLAKFEELYATFKDNTTIQSWLGFLQLQLNQPQKAIQFLELARKSGTKKDLEVLNNLGNAYYATGKFDQALEAYQAVSAENGKMFEPHYNSGNIYLKKKEYARALASFLSAAALKPDDAFTQNNLGVTHESMGNFAKAASSFKRAADLRIDSAVFARNAGLGLVRLGKSAEATPYLERATPNDVAVNLALADIYAKSGNREKALKSYEAVRESQGTSPTYWFNLGVLRAQNGDRDGAEQAYRRTLELSPNDLDALNNLGLMLFKKGEYAEAMDTFDRLSGLNPASMDAKINLGAAALRAGAFPRAIDSWKAVVRAAPGRTSVRLDLANLLYEQKDFEGARYHYTQVLLIEKDSAEALNGLGLLHLRESKLAQAEAAFRGSIAVNGKYLAAYNNLAITLERMNRKAQAIQMLEKALKIDPDDADVKRNLKRLRAEG